MDNETKPGLLARLRAALLNRATVPTKHPEKSRVHVASRTISGIHVNPDNILTSSVAWACCRFISESIAMMPWRAFRELPGGGAEIDKRHPVDQILYIRPNPELSTFQLKETLIHQALRWGNSFCEIERDTVGRPFALHLLHPDRVQVLRDDNGVLFYRVSNGIGGTVDLDAMDVLHIRGFGDDVVGYSVAEYAAQSIGWAMAASLFGASFFGNGANVALIVKNKTALSPEALAFQRSEFDQLYKGVNKSHRTAHVDNDTDVESVGTSPADSQMVEANRFLVDEVSRWFGVPPHIANELSRSTFSNIEHQSIEAVQRCLAPWVARLECEADYKLFGINPRGYYSRLDMEETLRGDFKTRAEGFKIYREMGVISADEIRDRIDMNPIGGIEGSMRTMNSTYAPLERIAGGTAQAAAPVPAQATA
ncbi:phage portal protein [Aquibium sp. LZ166]|uniref:Phage portal protein n=1 Tax=Aquibium pacificus TaxID=3153579 RepID=A0ABV3SJF9_9HYPH